VGAAEKVEDFGLVALAVAEALEGAHRVALGCKGTEAFDEGVVYREVLFY